MNYDTHLDIMKKAVQLRTNLAFVLQCANDCLKKTYFDRLGLLC